MLLIFFASHRYAIQELSTGYGKCLDYNTIIPILCTDKELSNILNIAHNTKSNITIGKLVEQLATHNELYVPTELSDSNVFCIYTRW